MTEELSTFLFLMLGYEVDVMVLNRDVERGKVSKRHGD